MGTRKNKRIGHCAGGRLPREQWDDLGKLVKAPRQTLVLVGNPFPPEWLIIAIRAEALVQAGVAEYSQDGRAVRPSEAGLKLVSAFGIEEKIV